MKIGILTSSNDMLALFNFLQSKDHEYVVRYDDMYGFWGDMPQDVVLKRICAGMDFLLSKNVDVVIVPPVVELLLSSGTVDCIAPIQILPLFSRYVLHSCLPFSLVGKV